MKRALASLALIVVTCALAGCGESRYLPSAPGAGALPPGTGVSGPRYVCVSDSTQKTCITIANPCAEILSNVRVHATSDVLSLQLFVRAAPWWKGQAFYAFLEGSDGSRFEFRRRGASCPVVADTLNNAQFDTIPLRFVGEVTGVPAGTYRLMMCHAFNHPCYRPPSDLDSSLQFTDTFGGSLRSCRLSS